MWCPRMIISPSPEYENTSGSVRPRSASSARHLHQPPRPVPLVIPKPILLQFPPRRVIQRLDHRRQHQTHALFLGRMRLPSTSHRQSHRRLRRPESQQHQQRRNEAILNAHGRSGRRPLVRHPVQKTRTDAIAPVNHRRPSATPFTVRSSINGSHFDQSTRLSSTFGAFPSAM